MAKEKKIILACPHGFCAGVYRAIRMLEIAIEKYGVPLYCLNEIVHNPIVVQSFSSRGVSFVADLDDVPQGSVVLFSAHGVAPSVRKHAERRQLKVLDATCPFVEKIHREVKRWSARGKRVFLVGHRNHEEIVGISGEAPESVTVVQSADEARSAEHIDASGVAVATQTTLSLDESEKVIAALEERYPDIVRPSRGDICYATINRQKAVRALAGQVDMVLVIGSRNSSNTNRLVEVAVSEGIRAELVDEPATLNRISLNGIDVLGMTSGASTPEGFTEQIITSLKAMGYNGLEKLEVVSEEQTLKVPEI